MKSATYEKIYWLLTKKRMQLEHRYSQLVHSVPKLNFLKLCSLNPFNSGLNNLQSCPRFDFCFGLFRYFQNAWVWKDNSFHQSFNFRLLSHFTLSIQYETAVCNDGEGELCYRNKASKRDCSGYLSYGYKSTKSHKWKKEGNNYFMIIQVSEFFFCLSVFGLKNYTSL